MSVDDQIGDKMSIGVAHWMTAKIIINGLLYDKCRALLTLKNMHILSDRQLSVHSDRYCLDVPEKDHTFPMNQPQALSPGRIYTIYIHRVIVARPGCAPTSATSHLR